MENKFFTPIWQVVGIRGLIAIALGLGALFWPQQTVTILKTLFAGFALVYGILTLLGGWRNPGGRQNAPIIKGGVAIVCGIAAFLWPDLTGLILLYLIAAYSIITGIIDVVSTYQLRPEQTPLRPLLLASGIAGIVFGTILVFAPGDGAITRSWLIGLYFLFVGGIGLFMAYRIRQAPQQLETAPV